MFTLKDAYLAASLLKINFDKFTVQEFLDGMNVELEHGYVNSNTNVTRDDLLITAKIALAHLWYRWAAQLLWLKRRQRMVRPF